MQVQLGGVGQAQARLDGFKSRTLKAEAPTQRHLYVTEWRALELQPVLSHGELAAGAGVGTQTPVLVRSSGAPVLGSWQHGGSAAGSFVKR